MAEAVEVFVQGILFPTNALQVAWVPLYIEQATVGSTHPAPFVKHPFLNVAHVALVVAVIGALEHTVRLQGVVGS